ncbi:MAG: ammonium transporter, partial [Gammaproteobacteria bacterium]|nr:ammonium transporter [Gammaproteobacteria bacterium]
MKRAILIAVAGLLLSGVASADTLDKADTAWLLTSTALVLFMTLPGLALFYGGLVGRRNVLSVLMQCFTIAGIVTFLWVIVQYSLAFSDGGAMNQWVGGFGSAFLAGVTVDSLSGTAPETIFIAFQLTFAIITCALIVGGFAERMQFSAMVLFSILWSLLVYAPICHWVWGGGWLADMGFLDFAGGAVVHLTAGVGALVAAMVLG